jgi:hypothetical protein
MALRVAFGSVLTSAGNVEIVEYQLGGRIRVPNWVKVLVRSRSYSRDEGFKVASKSKRAESGIFSCAEKASRFSNEGALIPRSIKLRKFTDIPRSSANCSWLNFLASLIDLRRWPNLSRRLGT